MIDQDSLLNEQKSAKFAGVSIETIKQYAEFGLLKISKQINDQLFFDKSDLVTVFHINNPEQNTSTETQPIKETKTSEVFFEQNNTDQMSHSSYEILEMNRTLRQQIEMLRNERDWLRERLEKFESRSERDHILLLSENQVVRTLLNTQQNQRPQSLWAKLTLPWTQTREGK